MPHATGHTRRRRRASAALLIAALVAPLLWWVAATALMFEVPDEPEDQDTQQERAEDEPEPDEQPHQERVTEMVLVYDSSPPPPAPLPELVLEPAPRVEPERIAQPEPEPEPEALVEPAPEPPPQVQDRRMPSVAQPESNEMAPLDARFLAEHDNVAEEETLARDTTLFDEAPTPQLAGASDESPDPGAEEDEAREDVPEQERPTAPEESMPRGTPEAVALAPTPPPAPTPPEPAASPFVEPVEPAEVPLPAQADPVAPGPAPAEPPPLPRMADAFTTPSEPSETLAAMAQPSFEAYAEVFGAQDGAAREALTREAAESSFVGDHQGRWERTRAALENFDVDVATGTETHLSTHSDAFAAYIHYLHNKIHPRWERYILWLDVNHGPGSHLADASLYTELEYVIGRDGLVSSVNIVRGSGETMFDSEAINLLYDIGPHEPPPPAMVSSNGNAYIHWEFHRGPEMCGTFNTSVRMVGGDAPTDGG